jgi:hypothetical protein
MSENGPILRAQLPAIPERSSSTEGPAGTFSNAGGVSRYQIGGGTAEQAPSQRLAPTVGAGVMRSTMTTDPMTGEKITTNDVLGDVQRGSSGDNAASTAPRFHTSGGRALLGNEIGPNSLVTVAGQTTNVRAALHAGLIVQNAHGVYVSADGSTASTEKTPAQQLEEANAERRAAEESDKDGLPTVAKFDDATEALLSETISKVGSIDAQQAVQAVINNGQLTPELIARIGSQLGLDKDQMTERSNTIVAAFTKQAREVVGDASADAVFAWAREAQPDALNRAMTAHANTGATEGYTQLAGQYFAGLADTKAGRAAILSSPEARAGNVMERNGKLYVNVAGVGFVEYRGALRSGVLTVKHG